MIGEMLQDHQNKLTKAVESAQQELTTLESSKTTLTQGLEDAKACLEEKKDAFFCAQELSKVAKEATKAAHDALTNAKNALKKHEANQADFEKQKTAIDAAYQEHFKVPMDAEE